MAALIALFALFAVFKLQLVKTEINNYRERVIHWTVNAHNVWITHQNPVPSVAYEVDYYDQTSQDLLVAHIAEMDHVANGETPGFGDGRPPEQEALARLLRNNEQLRDRTLDTLQSSLNRGAIALLLPLFLLTFTKPLEDNRVDLLIPLVLVSIYSAATVFYIIDAIIQTARD